MQNGAKKESKWSPKTQKQLLQKYKKIGGRSVVLSPDPQVKARWRGWPKAVGYIYIYIYPYIYIPYMGPYRTPRSYQHMLGL